MGMKIWKFILEITDAQQVQMPKNAKILSAQLQHGKLCVWALCDEEAELATRKFNVYGTGHKLPENAHIGEFVATFQMAAGSLVFHLFEVW